MILSRLRSLPFNLAFGVISVAYTLRAAVAALRPGDGPVRKAVAAYVHAMLWAMRVLAGIKIEVRGRERLPSGAFILAPKHASYGDGFSIYGEVADLAIVTGDHLERFPLFKTVLGKLGAIVVRRCGGRQAQSALSASASQAGRDGRSILIYPEGALAPVGVFYRYHSGVFHMARDLDLPVVPVASSLGLFWPQENWTKRPGLAVLEFLDPIRAEGSQADLLAALTRAVETRTAELVAEATGHPVRPAVFATPAQTAAAAKRPGAAAADLVADPPPQEPA